MTYDLPFPIMVYGSCISCFTGKLGNYFRIKGIPYQLQPMTARTVAPVVKPKTATIT
jgi:hypothetical protein